MSSHLDKILHAAVLQKRLAKKCGKSKKVVDKDTLFGYNIPCQQRRAAPDKPNNGDLHSGSAVDSDSTCGSSILSSPTRPQPNRLRYFRGIAQLVARLVRDEEAVGSNPAAPTEKDRYTFVCRSFSISAAGFERNPGCGSQRLFRPLGGPHILLAAAPTTPPCFRRWRRSSSLQLVTAASHSCTCFFI